MKQSNKSEDLGLTEVDYVSPNAKLSRHNALLYIFEDNEAVIQMIIKGRSPTMRHVSRIHRVALGCLFDRINLDPKIQIKDVHTRNKLAAMLTKSTFTRDEWHHLLRLSKFNIMNNSVFSRRDSGNRIDESLVCHVEARDAGETAWRGGYSRGWQVATCAKPGRFDPQPALSVAEFKFRFTKPGNTGASCSSSDYKHGETCCKGFEWEQRANFSSVPGRSGHGRKHGETCGRTSRASHQQKFGLQQPSRIVRKLDVCVLVCGLLCTSTKQMFSITRHWIHSLENEQVFGITNKIDWGLSPWRSCTIVHDNIVKRLKAKVSVFSDSVPCLGSKFPEYPRSAKACAEKVGYFVSTPLFRELDNVTCELVVFEWKIFPGHTTLDPLQEVKELMKKELKIQPQNFEDRIIFMSMYSVIDWTRRGNQQV